MADLDRQISTAMQKLTRASWPVKVLRNPSSLAKTQVQLEAFVNAKAGKDEGFLERMKYKMGLEKTPGLDAKIKELQGKVNELSTDFLEGELTPLTEREQWSVRAAFTHLELYLRTQLMAQGDTEEIKAANKAAEQTLSIMGNQVWCAKWVGYSLKKRSKEGLELYWKDGLVPDSVDPHIITQLYMQYQDAFVPTEEELKKSSAPMTRKTS